MMDIENSNWTPKAKKSWEDAVDLAKLNNHTVVNNCHLFCSFWQNSNTTFRLFMESRGIDINDNEILEIFIKYYKSNRKKFESNSPIEELSPSVRKTLKEAAKISSNKKNSYLGTEHILYGIIESDKHFCDFLLARDIDTEHFKLCIEVFLAGNSTIQIIDPDEDEDDDDYIEDDDEEFEQESSPLEKYCVNLNEYVLKPEFPKISGREKEISLMEEVLCRKIKSNCILVGEAGTGKTTIVEGLAQAIQNPEHKGPLKNKKIYSLDVSSLLSGTKYRGQLEKRFENLIEEFKKDKNKIIFIDEIHTIVGTGSKEGSNDISNMLKPALARGEIKCIGATTSSEYKKYFDVDAALSRRFHYVNVDEPSKEEVLNMIKNALPSYESHHNVKFSNEIAELAVNMCDIYLPNQRFPDKAFDVIDQACAKTRIRHKGRKSKVLESDICNVIADKTNINKDTIKQKYHQSFSLFEENINKIVFGQEENIKKIYDVLACSKVGLRDSTKPIASFFFVGPTSVGKTFTAKQISREFYGNEKSFLQLNMSEYQDQASISKLIGVSAGYVGFQEGGILTEFVRRNPNSLILFDEAEKCHYGVLNLLLQILDEAKLTDNLNREIDFSRCIIVMTSNVGSTKVKKNQLGFVTEERNEKQEFFSSVKEYLAPELMSRVDEVIVFNELDKQCIENIFNTEITKLKETLKEKGVSIKIDDEILSLVNQNSEIHSRKIKQIIRQEIEVPLAKFILKNPKNSEISIKVLDKKVNIE